MVKEVPSSYRWFSDNVPLSNDVRVVDYTHFGLEIIDGAILRSTSNEPPYKKNVLCYMETS